MFSEDAEETLDRAEERTVDHHRPLTGAIVCCVLELKALRQIEIELMLTSATCVQAHP